MADVVVARGLTRRFTTGGRTVEAVRDADLQVGDGEMLVLLGRSGAGKSTLLSLIGGLDRPDAGTVTVAGQDVPSLRGADLDRFLQRTVGWVFQTSGLLPLLTAAENVSLGLRVAGESEAASMQAAMAALESVGLAERADHRGNELSGGEQQRVAVARALIKAPHLLLADEPTAQLDTETSRSIIALLRQAADSGTAILFATHDESATELADRVIHMEDGVLSPWTGPLASAGTR
ncbi:MAG TPA: ABC transporter ATP-binding protein [Candidatus Dormibacteraeota bacterium]|jgi:putative ABC transport system ATP-binding protein